MGKMPGIVIFMLSLLTLLVGSVYGYLNNIISLVTQNDDVGMLAGRVIGIFIAPIGILLGYF